MCSLGKRRSAFTLVELLVVIAIFVVLAGLLLPAIQRIRESAAQMMCASNLKQITLATYNYHNDYNRFPPGYLGPLNNETSWTAGNVNTFQHVSTLYFLLPYMDRVTVWEKLRVNINDDIQQTGNAWFNTPANIPYASERLKIFECPADNVIRGISVGDGYTGLQNGAPAPGAILSQHFYNQTGAQGLFYIREIMPSTNPAATHLGRTNYFSVAGVGGRGTHTSSFSIGSPAVSVPGGGLNTYRGIFTNRSDTRMIDIRDGVSHTLMYHESQGGVALHDRDYWYTWIGSSNDASAGGIAQGTARWFNWSSAHPAVLLTGFGDGSVRSFRKGSSALSDLQLVYQGGASATAPGPDYLIILQLSGHNDAGNPDISAVLYSD
jgi:prepilin-type N-terminal cleavage/methylation domain-containing protein